jgi:hypothetical protein
MKWRDIPSAASAFADNDAIVEVAHNDAIVEVQERIVAHEDLMRKAGMSFESAFPTTLDVAPGVKTEVKEAIPALDLSRWTQHGKHTLLQAADVLADSVTKQPARLSFHVWNVKDDGMYVDVTPVEHEGIIKQLRNIHPDATCVYQEFEGKEKKEKIPVLAHVCMSHKQRIVGTFGKPAWNRFLTDLAAEPRGGCCVFNALAYKRVNGGRIVIGRCGWKTRSGGVYWEWE